MFGKNKKNNQNFETSVESETVVNDVDFVTNECEKPSDTALNVDFVDMDSVDDKVSDSFESVTEQTFSNKDYKSSTSHYENVLVLEDGSELTIEEGKGKKKYKKSDFVKMEGEMPVEDFVILNNKISKLSPLFKTLKIIFALLITVCLAIIAFFCISFRLVPGTIKGGNFNIGPYSVVSRNYSPNIDELQQGDVIISKNNDMEFLPVVVNFDLYTYESRNGYILNCKNENGESVQIQSVDVSYIIKGEW